MSTRCESRKAVCALYKRGEMNYANNITYIVLYKRFFGPYQIKPQTAQRTFCIEHAINKQQLTAAVDYVKL